MDISIEAKFNRLAEEWRNETGGYSLISQKCNHLLYRQIIDMGDTVLPYLIKDYKNNPRDWYHAITEIKSKQHPSTYI